MRADLKEEDLDTWVPPPLDPETETVLDAMGVTRATQPFDPEWRPVPRRPRWLAFIYRMLRINP
jgi:hypothetical protein